MHIHSLLISHMSARTLGTHVFIYARAKIEIPVIRHGKKQKIETLINEEALMLGKYFRGEIQNWNARIATVR